MTMIDSSALGDRPAPTGKASPAASVVTESYSNCNGSTKSSSVISDRTSGSTSIPGNKSPVVAKPSRMRNR